MGEMTGHAKDCWVMSIAERPLHCTCGFRIETLTARVAELEEDEARLDWWLDHPLCSIERKGTSEFDWCLFDDEGEEAAVRCGFESGREAIDAARAAKGGE